ncbi:quinone oxidoreductase-like protein 2-like [Quillaja saponaria]|uniref:Quinone oxidoreductase-like protein 2-like n=1 Tax=Quillaja saponaria TaxID=32244 RepID=A0AAD7LK77_QUISA|nr:quinone oxidoreductase-like protein 2-like [Quillaja saponaria]
MEALFCPKLGDPTVSVSSSPSSATGLENANPIFLLKNHPIPELDSPTAVRVRIKATSLNYANYLQILGKYQEKPPLPFIPRSDYSGFVDAIGPKVSNFKVGDAVCSFHGLGSFAEFTVVVTAGAIPVTFGTSHVALVHRARLTSGQVLLVLGAAGGVGLAAVQIGKVCGAIVIAVARGTEKVQFLKSLGVDHVVDGDHKNVTQSVKDFLKGRKLKGIDVLYDPVGGKLTEDTLRLLNWGANILVMGFASGEVPVIPANIALVMNWTVHGLYWSSYKIHQPAVLEDSLREILSWIARGLITVHMSHSCCLSEVNLAFSAIRDRKAIGKIVIVFDERNARSKL